MANDYAVRSGLLQKGYTNDDIGYDPNTGYVQVKGQNFIKPELNLNGTTYTSQSNFDNAYNQFNKNQRQAQTQQYTDQYINQATAPAANPYVDQYTQMIKDIQSRLNAPQQDVYSTPQYAAAQAQQQRAAQQGIRSAQEALGSAGFGRSTALGEAANRAQNSANEYLQLQLVPQIQQQLAAQRQQEINNQLGLLSPIMNLLGRQDTQNQNQLANTRGVIDLLNTQNQNDINNQRNDSADARANAGLTGYFMPPGAQDIINNILGLKQQAEQQGVTPEQLTQYRNAADAERAKLYQLGIDPSLVGFDSNYAQAAQNAANFRGIQTLQGRNNELNEIQLMGQLTGKLPDGTPTSAEQQRQLENAWKAADNLGVIGEQLGSLYNLPANTPTLQAKQIAAQLSISQQNANTSAFSAANSANNAAANLQLNRDKFDFDKQQATSAGNTKQISQSSYSEFTRDLPRIADINEGNALIDYYRQSGVDEATLQKMQSAVNKQFKE